MVRNVKLARHLMATRFELVLEGEDPLQLRAAGEEALNEIEQLEAQLSFYRPESELSGLNARGARGPVRLEPRFFRLLQRAADLSLETKGAFDPTVGPLVRCWGFAGRSGRIPSDEEIAAALEVVGVRHLRFDEENCAVAFDREGATLDLGAIGKGYALERAAAILRDLEVPAALIHAGTSSVYGLGAPAGCDGWKIGIRHPTEPEKQLTSVVLRDRALGVSAPHGKFFTRKGERYGHVLDPRSGRPVQAALLAAVAADSPTDADALSTALLVAGHGGLSEMAEVYERASAFVIEQRHGGPRQARLNWQDVA